MGPAPRTGDLRSRRWFLFAVPALSWAAKGDTALSAPSRYLDAATELPVTRLTDPAFHSALPPSHMRAIDRRGSFLLYASDASGRLQVHRLDLRRNESRQLTDAADLGPFCLLPAGNAFCYADGPSLWTAAFSSLRPRELYRAGGRIAHFNVSIDGLYAAVADPGPPERLRLVDLRTGAVATIAEADHAGMHNLALRPRRASVLYLREPGEAWLANYDGQQNYRLRLAPGRAAQAHWSPDGRGVLYLNVPADPGKLRNLREFVPDANEDRPIADTTQYDSFAVNADASMFLGVSASKASPYVFLLARKVTREFALCEHGGSGSAPVFSPSSQQIFFHSSQHGKSAIYRMEVDKLVAETAERP
jgi:oligogalacturonide lyase